MKVPKEFVLKLIRSGHGDIKDASVRAGNNKRLIRYLTPPRDPRSLGRPALRTLTIVGYMDMGKTVTATLLTQMVIERLKRYGVEPVAIGGKSIVDVVEYMRDNPDILAGTSALIMFIDDMLYQGTSVERRVKSLAEKYYSDIRHKPERLGLERGLIIVMFAGQRFRIIPPFFRNSPIILFKGVVAQDSYERSMILDVLKKGKGLYAAKMAELYLGILETTVTLALDDWIEDAKRLNIYVHFRDGPTIYIQPPGVPDPKKIFTWVPFNYSGAYDAGDEDEEEETRPIDNKRVLKLVAAAVNTGMTIRDYGLHSLSVRDIRYVLREVLGLMFDNNVITTEFLEELPINKKALKTWLERKLAKPIVLRNL